MNLLYCGDNNISTGLILSVLSVVNHTEEEVNIYLLTMSLHTDTRDYLPVSGETAAYLKKILREKGNTGQVICIDVAELFLSEIPQVNMKTRFTPYCMLRLFADRLPEIPDRLLYLDTDVLARGDIRPLFETDLKDNEFAGVLDYYGSHFFYRHFPRRDYVNSGVLLLNMKRIRETDLFGRCRKLIASEKMFMPDQSALNKLASKKLLLPRKYNDQRKLHEDTVLQHFTTSFRFFPYIHTVTVKPWDFERVHSVLKLREYDDLFDEYRRLTTDRKGSE